MIPGEIITKSTEVEINNHHPETVIEVENTGDRPIQVGSHFHFYEANAALDFERELAYGKHLDIPAGAAVRFEPGDKKEVQLVEYAGKRKILVFVVWSMVLSMSHVSIAQLMKMMNMQVYSEITVMKRE